MMMAFLTKAAAKSPLLTRNSYIVVELESTFSCFLSRFSTLPTVNVNEPAASNRAAVSRILMHKHHFSPEAARHVSSALSCRISPERVDSLLSFLTERGVSDTQLKILVTRTPRFLTAGLESMEPKFKILQDFISSAPDAVEILFKNPWILNRAASNLTSTLSIYKSLLGSSDRLASFLRVHRVLFNSDLERTLLPNIEFLKSCGIPLDKITNQLYDGPNSLAIKPENMRNAVRKLDQMGVERTSTMFIKSVVAVSSLSKENWEMKLKTLKGLGFSEDDIARALKHAPVVFALSEQKMKTVTEVLLETGKYDISCIVKNPMSLSYSVERRYKPRLQLLKRLEKRNLIEKWPGLSKLYSLTDSSFSQKFDEETLAGETIIAKNAISCKSKTFST